MNHECPPSLSEYGEIRKSNAKSDFLDFLSKVDVTESFTLNHQWMLVIDGPAFFHLHPPTILNTFDEYCKN